jgi:hypothetical protein
VIPASVQAEIDAVWGTGGGRAEIERIAALAVRETARDCAEMLKARFCVIRDDYSEDTVYYYLDELQHTEEAIRARFGIKETT